MSSTLAEDKWEEKYKNSIVKEAPGYDLIKAKMLKELPKKRVIDLTQIYNAIIRI